MDAFDIFGVAALAFSLIVMGQLSQLKKEVEELKAKTAQKGGIENAPDSQH